MRVRRAETGEYPALGDLMVAAYSEFMRGPDDPYLESLRDVARRDQEAQVWVLVDTDDERVLGCVTWCPPGSRWREISDPAQGEFRMLAVDPAARGRGAGEALVRHCEALSVATGATEMVLSSLDAMTAAHRLYARLGYRRVPDLDWDPNPGVHLIAYSKDMAMSDAFPTVTLSFTVTADDTAEALGSGSLAVLGTPRMLAWCEAATCQAIDAALPEGSTSVGTRVSLEHLGASPVGALVEVTATQVYADGRLHRFSVAARHVGGTAKGAGVVATGEITRVVVEAQRFVGRL